MINSVKENSKVVLYNIYLLSSNNTIDSKDVFFCFCFFLDPFELDGKTTLVRVRRNSTVSLYLVLTIAPLPASIQFRSHSLLVQALSSILVFLLML